MLDTVHYKKFHLQILRDITVYREAFQEFAMNHTHPNQTSHLFLLTQTFTCGSIVSTMTRIYARRSGVQILAEARELSLLQNILTSSSTAEPPAHWTLDIFSGSKVARADSLTIHICLQPSLNNSGAIPPLNLSASMAQSGTTLFYLNLLPMYISLKRSHPFQSYKGTFLYITYLLQAHYMTHLFHLHWKN